MIQPFSPYNVKVEGKVQLGEELATIIKSIGSQVLSKSLFGGQGNTDESQSHDKTNLYGEHLKKSPTNGQGKIGQKFATMLKALGRKVNSDESQSHEETDLSGEHSKESPTNGQRNEQIGEKLAKMLKGFGSQFISHNSDEAQSHEKNMHLYGKHSKKGPWNTIKVK